MPRDGECDDGESFPEAERLHSEVSADRWCVSRRDLHILKSEVRAAIGQGRIYPTPTDQFDADDHTTGPSIYTVADQYIKPVTREAGGMSWALMLHPEGLACDVFITHAWQEGLFEFVNQTLRSLPCMTRNVWCCFLANPQNLDIASMIRRPRDSPFAKALRAASYVLVVPNSKTSAYTRLWCAYEAYLAHELNKAIQIARPPLLEAELCCDFSFACGAMVLGALFGSALFWSLGPESLSVHFWIYRTYTVWQFPLMLASTVSREPWRRQWLNLGGLFMGAFTLAFVLYAWRRDRYALLSLSEQDILSCKDWKFSKVFYATTVTVFFVITELDRVRYLIARRQADQLQKGYTGSIRGAICSCAADEANIRAEIGSRTDEVDTTINLLVRAGLSTPSLRAAQRLGVEMAGAGFSEYAFAFLMFTSSWAGGWRLRDHMFSYRMNSALDLGVYVCLFMNKAFSLAFVMYFAGMPADARAFAYRVLHKCGASVAILPWALIAIWHLKGGITFGEMQILMHMTMLIIWLVVFPVSVARIHRVARIPHCGPMIANILATRGLYVCSVPLRAREHPSTASVEDMVISELDAGSSHFRQFQALLSIGRVTSQTTDTESTDEE